MICGTTIINACDPLPGQPLDVANLPRSQALEVVVPPIKPTPKEGRELTKVKHRHYNIEPFRGLGCLVEPLQNCAGLVPKCVAVNLSLLERAFQTAQLIGHDQTVNKDRNFWGV